MAQLKAKELRTKTSADLVGQLQDLKKKLFDLRVLQTTQKNRSRVSAIRTTRKDIARVMHVNHENRVEEAKKKWEGKEVIPKAMRPKMCRKMRKAMTESQLKKVTKAQHKNLMSLRLLNYALVL